MVLARRGRSPQRRTVFDRLEQGPPRGRGVVQGEAFRDQRMIEIDVNPQDVPRGKCYFLVSLLFPEIAIKSIKLLFKLVAVQENREHLHCSRMMC